MGGRTGDCGGDVDVVVRAWDDVGVGAVVADDAAKVREAVQGADVILPYVLR